MVRLSLIAIGVVVLVAAASRIVLTGRRGAASGRWFLVLVVAGLALAIALTW